MAVRTFTETNFETEVLKSEKPVLIDFWASWCGPCKMMAPVIDQVAEQTDRAVVGKVNVDEETALAEKYGIMSIPTLVLIKNGIVVEKVVGLQSKEVILDLIEK